MDDRYQDAATETKALLFLQALKKSTATPHSLLESNTLLSAIMTPQVSLRQYYCYLILMNKIEAVYEEYILPQLTSIESLPVQRKASGMIADDLESIHYNPLQNVEIKEFRLPDKKITAPFALGFMYVMKGSKLGGKVIFKHLQRRLNLSENNGAQYISDHGVDTIAGWKEFLSFFSTYTIDNGCETKTIEGAHAAFASIYDFFESNRLMYEI